MKILPINNIFNINRNYNRQISFKEVDTDGGLYIRTDSYVDETGLHFSRNRVELPDFSPIIEERTERVKPKNIYEIRENAFITQEQYDLRGYDDYSINKDKKCLQKALYDLDLEKINDIINKLDSRIPYQERRILGQPFFALGLADIPMTDDNKELYQTILNKLERANGSVNAMDENGITLLEKVMNAENEPFLTTIREVCRKQGNSNSPAGIAYDSMQKYAFDNIQNPEFKEKCKNLPIKFYEIIDDIKRKDLISLDKDIQEQMKCGFCDLKYAIRESLYLPVERFKSSEYTRIVLNIAKKHFPNEIKAFAKAYL